MAKAPLPKPRRLWSHSEARFDECVDCVFYRPFHTHKTCDGCEAGENFQEIIEELDPYAEKFLSKKSR